MNTEWAVRDDGEEVEVVDRYRRQLARVTPIAPEADGIPERPATPEEMLNQARTHAALLSAAPELLAVAREVMTLANYSTPTTIAQFLREIVAPLAREAIHKAMGGNRPL